MNDDGYLFAACSVVFTFISAGMVVFCYYLFTGDPSITREMGIGVIIVAPLAVLGSLAGSLMLGLSAFSPKIRAKLFKKLGDNEDVLYCSNCGYDLRGTSVKGIDRCPECGDSVPANQAEKIREKMSD